VRFSLKASASAAASASVTAAPAPAPPPEPYARLRAESAEALRAEDAVFAQVVAGNTALEQIVRTGLRARALPILQRAWQKLRSLRWEAWPHGGGSPFVAKITKGNCAAQGVADYFSFVRRPMDLTRMEEKLKAQEKGEEGYGDAPDAFLEDAMLIAHNAKVFNGPDCARAAPHVFPDPKSQTAASGFGPASVYGMAHDFEEEVRRLQAPVRACFAQLRRLEQRHAVGLVLEARPDALGAGHAYSSEAFRVSLRAATADFAQAHKINITQRTA